MLDYQWVKGDPRTALSQPNTVVLTRAYAEKYFGTTDVVNKILRLNNKQDLLVAGVLEDHPQQLVSISIWWYHFYHQKYHPDIDLNKWNGWNDNFQAFILLKNGVNPDQLTKRFQHITVKYIARKPWRISAFS